MCVGQVWEGPEPTVPGGCYPHLRVLTCLGSSLTLCFWDLRRLHHPGMMDHELCFQPFSREGLGEAENSQLLIQAGSSW